MDFKNQKRQNDSLLSLSKFLAFYFYHYLVLSGLVLCVRIYYIFVSISLCIKKINDKCVFSIYGDKL